MTYVYYLAAGILACTALYVWLTQQARSHKAKEVDEQSRKQRQAEKDWSKTWDKIHHKRMD
jgi:hypothetical protein